jgi:AraC-like DNA-binding protein
VGAVLSPLGWARLTGLHAAEHCDAMYDAAEILGPAWGELADRLRDMAAAEGVEPIDLVGPIEQQLLALLQPIDPRHAAMIKETGRWLASSLDPPIEDLYRRLDYSDRQVQRLTERFFGGPPKALVRKFRALRVFSMLLSPATPDAEASAVIDLYYDQSHLIREFRRFIGRTPKQLQAARMPILSAMVARRNYRAIWPEKPPQAEG